MRFTQLLEDARSRIEIIVIFLAVLESIKRKLINAQQDELFGEIVLLRKAAEASVEAHLAAMNKVVREGFMAMVARHGRLTYMKPREDMPLVRFDGYKPDTRYQKPTGFCMPPDTTLELPCAPSGLAL